MVYGVTVLVALPPDPSPRLILTLTNPLLNPQPVSSFNPKDKIMKALQVSSLEKEVEKIPKLELQGTNYQSNTLPRDLTLVIATTV
ncbi:hypothetical protein PAXRUDRAFT_17468 [Paxillus rubicundulus Ve08.2h10]|uniref:Uncharacterized protein n=1 Tax=Paxillus rubicundulus Ve08.2h10 TaxID=930991 RepID=A0A0D0CQ63_9AGAM|nr:hypothetical protein PAXRUDRAFT_17468 [Paxillus rubicundulus Ve08.2h10]